MCEFCKHGETLIEEREGYKATFWYIDAETKSLVRIISYKDDPILHSKNILSLNYCPICGKEL